MGLTTLDVEPMMCVLIIAGKKANALVKMGINDNKEMIDGEGYDIIL